MSGALFDLEPHGTPCLVCGELACVCRAAGTLDATPGAWPIDPPRASEQIDNSPEAVEARRAMFQGLGWGVS